MSESSNTRNGERLPSEREQWEIRKLARFLAQKIFPRHPDGFTFDPLRWECRSCFRENVFILSLNGHCRRLKTLPSEFELRHWLEGRWELLCRSGHFIGNWRNKENNLFYLDVSIAVVGLDRALLLARRHRQACLFYPAEEVNIEVPSLNVRDRETSKSVRDNESA